MICGLISPPVGCHGFIVRLTLREMLVSAGVVGGRGKRERLVGIAVHAGRTDPTADGPVPNEAVLFCVMFQDLPVLWLCFGVTCLCEVVVLA